MDTKKLFVFFLPVFFPVFVQAQNLVLNPSFEDFTHCAQSIGDMFIPEYPPTAGEETVHNWWQVAGTSDYFHAGHCSQNQNYTVGVPNNFAGLQAAYDGDAYCGLYSFINKPGSNTEYIQGELSQSLTAGQTYRVSFQVSPTFVGEVSAITEGFAGIGFLMMDELLNLWPISNPPYDNQLENHGIVFPMEQMYLQPITDTVGWTCVSFTYVAQGGEKAILIGNPFINAPVYFDAQGNQQPIPDSSGLYQYIDMVVVEPLNTVPQGTDTTLLLCPNESVILGASGNAANYFWSTGANTDSIQVNAPGTYWVTKSIGCEMVTDTFFVEPSNDCEPGVLMVSVNGTTICKGDCFDLLAVVEGSGGQPLTFDWNNAITEEDAQVTVCPQTTTTYEVVVKDTSGNQASTTVILLVEEKPSVDFSFEPGCPDINFMAHTNPATTITTYTWDFGDSSVGNGSQVAHPYAQTGTYLVGLTLSTANQCTNSIIKPVTITQVGSLPPLPNIITTNGDGVNDVIDMENFLGGCGEYEFVIFNRWGNKLFTQRTDGAPFVGKNALGAWVVPGVYFYTLRYGKQKKSGNITVIR